MNQNNQNSVLKTFYQERKQRDNQIKQHRLLKKNISYFTSINHTLQTPNTHPNTLQFVKPPIPIKSNHSKSLTPTNCNIISQTLPNSSAILPNYIPINSRNFQKSLNSTITPQNSKPQITNQNKTEKALRRRSLDGTLLRQYKYQKLNQDILIGAQQSQYIKTEQQNRKQIQQSPQFKQHIFEEQESFRKKQEKKQEDIVMRNKQMQEQIKELKKKMKQIEQQRYYERKFIQCIRKMRVVVMKHNGQQVKEECTLKELWKWIKSLPHI